MMVVTKYSALILIGLLLVTGAQSARAKDRDPNSGTLVMAVGEAPDMYFSWYRWKYRRVGDTRIESMEIMGNNNDFATRRDFKGEELGRVLSQDLPAGDYEFVSIETDQQEGVTTITSESAAFSMPFHITAGKAIYVGDFMAQIGSFRKNFFGMKVPTSIYFTVSDKSARDLPLAQKLYPGLGELVLSVVDADAAHHPLLSSKVRN